MEESSDKSLKDNIFVNIKSNFVLKRIFNILPEKTLLEIIQYNKIIQKRINKDIQDFKKYLNIEIEIIPAESGKFINIPKNKSQQSYYHIFFDDSRKEIKNIYSITNEIKSKIKIIVDFEIQSLRQLFEDGEGIKILKFTKFNRKDIIDMSYMFYQCTSLTQIDLSKMKTDEVKDMRSMFKGCTSLKELNLSNFNVEKVEDFGWMFYGCKSLLKLNLANFYTPSLIRTNHMFHGCLSLKELNLSKFNTDNVWDMSGMFYECNSLIELDLSNFNTKNVRDMYCLFYNCSSLVKLNISNFNFNNVKDMRNFLYYNKYGNENKNKKTIIIYPDEIIKYHIQNL